jgi:hypothetical protein
MRDLDTPAVYEREVGNVLGVTKFETLGDIGVALNVLFNEIRCGAIELREARRHIAHLNHLSKVLQGEMKRKMSKKKFRGQ